MTISAIKEAIRSLKRLYINSKEVEIVFFDEITETIEVKYINSDEVTFITKSSLSECQKEDKAIVVDDLLILQYRGGLDV